MESPSFETLYKAVCLDIHNSAPDLGISTWGSPCEHFGPLYQRLECPHPRDPLAVASLALLKSLAKSSTADDLAEPLNIRQANARDGFVAANEKCAETNDRLRSRRAGPLMGEDAFQNTINSVIGEAQLFVNNLLLKQDDDGWCDSNVPLRDLAVSLRCGPGAAVGASGTSFFEKTAASRLTCTSEGLFEFYKRFIRISPLLVDVDGVERQTFPSLPRWQLTETNRECIFGHEVVGGSRMAYAPKNWKTERLICTEPSVNMMMQLGLGSILQRSLAKWGLDKTTQQPRNNALAKRGSENQGWVTIDLSSASDSVSIELVRDLFPPDWFEWFMFTRSPTTLCDGRPLQLNMLSSMGNGFTFEVETCVFLALVVGVYRVLDLPIQPPSRTSTGNVAVFGDDIIVIPEAAPLLRLVLDYCGFTVNSGKSYFHGPFRESCGGNYLLGVDVTGVKCKKLDTVQDCYSLLNRLYRWGATWGISFPRVTRLLLPHDPFFVPPFEADDAGLHVPASVYSGFTAGKTLAAVTGCDEKTKVYRCFSPRDSRRPVYSVRKYRNPDGSTERVWGLRLEFSLFIDGVILGTMQGCIRSSHLGTRPNKVSYKQTLKAAPGWGSSFGGDDMIHYVVGSRDHPWERVVTASLGN